jgi:hypothetical protein
VVRDDLTWTDAMREELAEELSLDLDGVNVEFVTVDSDDHLTMKCDRARCGVDEGLRDRHLCARSAVAHREEMCGTDVTVDNPGGALHVTLNGAAATLSGAGAVRRERGMARSVTYIPTTLIDRTFREKIVLVGVQFPGVTEDELDYQLDELALLVDTAGADVVARESSNVATRPIRRRSSARARYRNFERSVSRSTPTRWSSNTTCHRPNSATWRRSSGERRSTAPR